MRDTNNRIAVRRKAEDLHGRLENPLFSLYLFFLQPILDILADINRQPQKANQSLYVTCCKIKVFKTTLMEPLLVDPGKNTTEGLLMMCLNIYLGVSFKNTNRDVWNIACLWRGKWLMPRK